MPLVQGTVEWSTQGGEKTAAQMSQELNWYMQEGLEEASMLILEEMPTTSACLMIQIILQTNLGCKGGALYMELSGPQGLAGQKGEQEVAGAPGPRNGGVVYTRWGKTSCPNVSGTQLVYAGRAGGSWYAHTGGGTNYLRVRRTTQSCS